MTNPSAPQHGGLVRVLPALTFVLGVVLGGVFVGVGLVGGGAADDQSGPTATTGAPTSGNAGSEASPDTAVIVPAACAEAAGAVNKAVALIRKGAASVRDFQPKMLTQVLDDLEVLDPKLRELTRRCSQVEVTPASPESTNLTPSPPSPTG